MRSIRLLAATTLILFGAAACGDDNGGGTGINQDPTASFTGGPCTAGAACTFNDTSSDPEGANTITRREWNFGDGTAVVVDPGLTPSHTYQVAGDYTVTLTVTDNGNNTATATQTITVTTGTPTNAAPTANFTVPSCVVNVACLFTDTSTDTDGVVSAWSWTFGDGTAAVLEQNPSHTYAVEGNYNVELTVTDDDGATDIITQVVTVAPPAATQCTSSGATTVDCALAITTRSTVTVTLADVSCELTGNRVTWGTVSPFSRTVFFNVCTRAPGSQQTLLDGTGAPAVFEAGSQVVLRFTRGTPDATDPPATAPAANLEGTHPSWNIAIDDGGNAGGAGEPDFADVTLSVSATAAP